MTWPVKGGLTEQQVEKLFHLAGDKPRRGISPARGKRFGRFSVVGFEVLGPLRTRGLEGLLDNLPPELRTQFKSARPALPTKLTVAHAQYMYDAQKRLQDVDLKSGAGGADKEGAEKEEDDTDT